MPWTPENIPPYTRSPKPQFPGSEKEYFDREFQKLEQAFRALAEAVVQIRTRLPTPP